MTFPVAGAPPLRVSSTDIAQIQGCLSRSSLFAAMGKFELVGGRELGIALPLLGQALVGMLLALGRLITRGYGLAFCHRFHLMTRYVFLTGAVYALDDSWSEGIELGNLFSP